MVSELATKFIKAKYFTKGRHGQKICKITPHIMAAVWTGERCAEFFKGGTREASANYCIGYDGDIVCSVKEENRAWSSANANNDEQAITIECSNDVIGGDWHISNKTWDSLVNLCVDICKRYNFKLVYDGTPNGSLTRHNMFINTTCPGKYLQGRFQELADTVNKRLEESEMFDTNQEYEALEYLVERGIINTPEYWKQAIETTYNVDHLIIKFANYVKTHT
jgi:hypothetical protein